MGRRLVALAIGVWISSFSAAARLAFTQWLHVAAAVSAATATAAAFVAFVLLRRVHPNSEPDEPPEAGPSPGRGERRDSVEAYAS